MRTDAQIEREQAHLREKYGFVWFTDSPSTGWPECLCSVCLKPIPETRDDVILRMWWNDGELEARFHNVCIPAEYGGPRPLRAETQFMGWPEERE